MTEPGIEKHYRVRKLCSILGLSDRSVRRLIASEADIVVLPEKKARFKRAYQTSLVPESVVRRILTRLSRVN